MINLKINKTKSISKRSFLSNEINIIDNGDKLNNHELILITTPT